MKTLHRCAVLVAAVCVVSVRAAPFLAIGDGAELFLFGTPQVRVDNNVLLDAKKLSDTIFVLNPCAQLVFGKNQDYKGTVALVASFANYSSHSNLNSNLFSGVFTSNYNVGKRKLQCDLGYHELNDNTPDVQSPHRLAPFDYYPTRNITFGYYPTRDITFGYPTYEFEIVQNLTRRNVAFGSASCEFELTQRKSIRTGFSHTRTQYKRASYSDSRDTIVPLTLFYNLLSKVDVSTGYRFRGHTDELGLDSKDHYFSIGGRGDIARNLGSVA